MAERERLRAEETAKFLAGLFEVADPTEAQGKEITAREILERGALRIQQELKDAPETQANLMETIGRVYLSLGLTAEARPQLEKALVMRETALPGRPRLPRRRTSAPSASWSKPPAASTLAAEALSGRARHERATARRTTTSRSPTSLEELGQFLKVQGDCQRRRTTPAGQPGACSLSSKVARSTRVSSVMNEFAQLKERRGDMAGAEDFYRRALAIDRAALGNDHPQVAYQAHNLAVALQSRGAFDDARPLFQESTALLQARAGRQASRHARRARQLRSLPASRRRPPGGRRRVPPGAEGQRRGARRRPSVRRLRPRQSRQRCFCLKDEARRTRRKNSEPH